MVILNYLASWHASKVETSREEKHRSMINGVGGLNIDSWNRSAYFNNPSEDFKDSFCRSKFDPLCRGAPLILSSSVDNTMAKENTSHKSAYINKRGREFRDTMQPTTAIGRVKTFVYYFQTLSLLWLTT